MKWTAAFAALFAFLLGACVSTSQIGPYVKHVARDGDWLVVHKCIIVLEGDTLSETSCTVEQVPLRAIPQGAPPPAGMPPAGMPPAGMPPAAVSPSGPGAQDVPSAPR